MTTKIKYKPTWFDLIGERAGLFAARVDSTGVAKDGVRSVTVVRARRPWAESDPEPEPGPGAAAAFCNYLEEECGIPFARPAVVWGEAEYAKLDAACRKTHERWVAPGVKAEVADVPSSNDWWRVTVWLPRQVPAERAPPQIQDTIDTGLKLGLWIPDPDSVFNPRTVAGSKVYAPGDRVYSFGKPPSERYKYYYVAGYRTPGGSMFRLLRVHEKTSRAKYVSATNIRLYVGEEEVPVTPEPDTYPLKSESFSQQ